MNHPKIKKKKLYWQNIDIERLEELKECKFVCETQLKTTTGGWSTFPVQVYWQEKPPEGYSNFFGLYVQDHIPHRLVICSVDKDFDFNVNALITPQNELIYSSYNHDMAWDSTKQFAIDGGRDYVKLTGKIELCKMARYNLATQKIDNIRSV